MNHRTISTLALAGALSLAVASAAAAPVTYRMDPAHTSVAAQWNHFGFSNPVIQFGDAEGSIVYDADDVSASSVQVTLPLSGMESNVSAFNEHLRSADFFNVEQFPEASFRSTSVEADGEGRLKVTGDLTIKDVTRQVVLEATINAVGPHPMNQRQTVGFDAVATINRSDFGLGMHVPHVADAVQLRITTEAQVPADDNGA